MLAAAILAAPNVLFAKGPGQSAQVQTEKLPYAIDRANVPDAIAKVKSGEFGMVHVDLIARANAIEGIPALKEQFDLVQDALLKDKIAAALVRLGEKSDKYWDFGVTEARTALENNAPSFITYDSEGKAVSAPSPEFEAWLQMSGTSAESAPKDAMYVLPGRVLLLGWSEDPRTAPYLRQGLFSPNYMIQIAAARGLAEIGDESSIPLIVEACEKAPSEVASGMVGALVYFDNSSAQKTVDKFIPKDRAKIYRDAKANGKNKPLAAPLQGRPNE